MSVVRVTVERPVIGVTANSIPPGGYQALDAGLTSLLSVDTAADLLPYTTAANTWASTALTSWARSYLALTTAVAGRTALGITEYAVVPGSTSDAVTGTVAVTIPLAAGTYHLTGRLLLGSVAGATAVHVRGTASGGLVASHAYFGWTVYIATAFGVPTDLDVWTSYGSGFGGVTRLVTLDAWILVTTPGSLLLEYRSETGGSSVSAEHGNVCVTRVDP